jgi:hypothetical protein
LNTIHHLRSFFGASVHGIGIAGFCSPFNVVPGQYLLPTDQIPAFVDLTQEISTVQSNEAQENAPNHLVNFKRRKVSVASL